MFLKGFLQFSICSWYGDFGNIWFFAPKFAKIMLIFGGKFKYWKIDIFWVFFQFLWVAFFLIEFWMHFPSQYWIKVKSILGMTYDTQFLQKRACMRQVSHAVHRRHCRLSFWSGYYHDFSSLDIPSGSFFFKKPFYFYSSNGQKRTKSNNRKSEDFTDYRSTT